MRWHLRVVQSLLMLSDSLCYCLTFAMSSFIFSHKVNRPLTPLRLIFYRPVATQRSFRERSNKHKGKKKQPPSSQNVSISFPLGRPTADNVKSLCENQTLRPLYSVKCLAGPRYKLLTQQAKSTNRMEKGFKQCCKKKQGVLDCAEQKVTC